ncbi:helix-turn-helix transcriptional regulator [Oscillibacter sp.]|jgi:transcriptional regulator with XRE-family HTH domain|uniref:helix-turn-helix domain-containing protein n=1 Tax=Oscillibacter sp. TaxID=1945593 RepID=UPI00217205B3|nr:helix-turn-helix transcriptional regulator [Oscillibacter sp.]MCI9240753.1 helix-turn-helix transcriptional regulator [Oscillibacter sp.]
MLTEFGKILRKLRIDRQELLRDMAKNLEVSSAYLSAVETGKRKIPIDWCSKISTLYKLDPDTIRELEWAYENSAQEIRIPLVGVPVQKKEAVISFAKALDGLNDKELKRIMEIVNGRKE